MYKKLSKMIVFTHFRQFPINIKLLNERYSANELRKNKQSE